MAKGFFSQLLKGRVAGHPVHVMLVHFPSALYPFSIALDWLAVYTGQAAYSFSAYYALLGAVGMSGLVMTFGVIDLLKIDPKHPAWKTAILHGGLNLLWLLAFATMLGIRMKNDPDGIQGYAYLTFSTVLVAGLLYSNFLGGELVLKHGIGAKEG